jgi:hypothetical protein
MAQTPPAASGVVAEPHVYQRGFKQFRNLCVGMPTVHSGEHGQVRPVEASDQQVASGVDQPY